MKTSAIKPSNNKVLIIEESQFFSSTMAAHLKNHLGLEAVTCNTLKQAEAFLKKEKDELLAVVSALVLQDALDGEVVDLAVKSKVPTIVLTASYSEEVRQRFLEKDIVDFFIKADISLEMVANTLSRLQRNHEVAVLVADDSPVTRTMAVRFLKRHFFDVYQADDGAKALKLINDNPQISILITDRDMPQLNGFQLTREVRKIRSREELAIIGVSAFDSDIKPAKFLKTGADDFLAKPFSKEELFCRVYQNVERLENLQKIKKSKRIDHLTGLMSRSTFLGEAPKILTQAKRDDELRHITFIGIDFLPKINADFGYSEGDDIIRQFSDVLEKTMADSCCASRFGGGEFCFLSIGKSEKQMRKQSEKLKAAIESKTLGTEDHPINITATIAVIASRKSNLDQMLISAHNCMVVVRSGGVGQLEYLEIT